MEVMHGRVRKNVIGGVTFIRQKAWHEKRNDIQEKRIDRRDSKNSGIRGDTGSRENCEKFCKRFKREEIRYDRGEKNSKDNGKAGRKKNRETSGKKE